MFLHRSITVGFGRLRAQCTHIFSPVNATSVSRTILPTTPNRRGILLVGNEMKRSVGSMKGPLRPSGHPLPPVVRYPKPLLRNPQIRHRSLAVSHHEKTTTSLASLARGQREIRDRLIALEAQAQLVHGHRAAAIWSMILVMLAFVPRAGPVETDPRETGFVSFVD